MPHLVLPLSGCLSRHTPTRATRGEARGHRSVLAQNSLLMYPFFFFGCMPAWCRPMAFLCGHVGRRRTHSTMALVLCVVCASPLGVGVDRRRVCPHRRGFGPWCTAGVNGVATVLGTMVLRGSVCGNRGRRAYNGYPSGSGRFGDDCSFRSYPLVYLCRCGARLLRPEGLYSMATHPVIHDDPHRRPDRSAFTLTGPSPILRCWFGKGTPLIAAEPLSWVSPCLTSCCLCRDA